MVSIGLGLTGLGLGAYGHRVYILLPFVVAASRAKQQCSLNQCAQHTRIVHVNDALRVSVTKLPGRSDRMRQHSCIYFLSDFVYDCICMYLYLYLYLPSDGK